MDYLEKADVVRHPSWENFCKSLGGARRVLLTTKAEAAYTDFAFRAHDVLILGRESAGVPTDVHQAVEARLRIPMRAGMRSLNVAQAGAIVLTEALRQTGRFA